MCLYQLKESFRNPRNLRPDRGKVWNKEAPHSVKVMKVRALKLDLPNHLPVVLVRWKGLTRLEVSLGYTHLQEGSEGGSGKPQTPLWLWPWCRSSWVLSWGIYRTAWCSGPGRTAGTA